YVSKHGEDGNFAGAGFWIGKSYKALGQNDKAIDKYLQTVVQFGDKLENDDVDLILRELIDETKEGESAASRSALESRLSQELNKARSQHQEILAIRLETLFTYISDGATREKYVKAVFETDVEKAGPLTLLLMATESAARGKADVVHQVYQHCMEKYAESEILVDVMNMELKALLDEEQYKKVETLAEEITNRFGYRAEVGLTRKLKADAYRLTKQSDLAIKTYEELFKVREWRGPLTAESLYWIGVCHYDLGNEQEALAFFKRVAVMYENYTKWMAKANEGAILCLEKKGQTDEIIAICQEILANDEAAATPEGVRARTRLNKLLPQGDAK
ncbi:MAG: tetratricopeptide repeat protein, partial [Kiritimatiellaceae bacterium]|nr:tetratricopeptide repeat protein [Kiritimatiellaceae bacterium]